MPLPKMPRWLAKRLADFIAPKDPLYDTDAWAEYAEIAEALREGDIAFLEALAAKSSDFPHNADRPLNRSWLRNAIDIGCIASIEWILDQGVAIDGYDNDGSSALTAAIEREWPKLGDKYDSLEIVTLLIAKGADVNARNPWFGSTPLHVAAAHGSAEVIALLLEKGADPLAWNKDSLGPDQPIDFVNTRKRPEIRDLLRAAMEKAEQ